MGFEDMMKGVQACDNSKQKCVVVDDDGEAEEICDPFTGECYPVEQQ